MRGLRSYLVCSACGWCCLLAAAPAAASESFKRLTSNEIRQRFAGHTIGDDVHWSYYFGPDGSVEAVDLGQARQGSWKLAGGELCLAFKERGKMLTECYEVWLAGNKVRYRRDGITVIEGLLTDR